MKMNSNEMTLPVMTMEYCFHVGFMDINEKEHTSYEGSGLSVSLYPEAWISIARLGGRPTHQLTKERGGQFLDFHKIAENAQLKQMILDWGLSEGYIVETLVYKVAFYNEYEEEIYYLFDDEQEALEEYESIHELEEGYDVAPILEQITQNGLKALPLLCDATMRKHISSSEVFDLLVTVWAETLDGLDGVYWDDLLDVEGYSAPRAVIFNRKLADWVVSQPYRESLDEEW